MKLVFSESQHRQMEGHSNTGTIGDAIDNGDGTYTYEVPAEVGARLALISGTTAQRGLEDLLKYVAVGATGTRQ